jgi:hypothetical protein
VGAGQPSQGSCVGIGHAPYFMLRHDTLEELQLGPRQGTRAGQGTQSIQDLWKGVAPLRIVVDRRERLVTCRDGLLHCWSGKTSSTERVVRACVVLVWPETILIEHECSAHVEEDGREAGEDVGCGHARQRIEGFGNGV